LENDYMNGAYQGTHSIQDMTWMMDGSAFVVGILRSARSPSHWLERYSSDGSGRQVVFDAEGPEVEPAFSITGRLAYFARWSVEGNSVNPEHGLYVDGTLICHPCWHSGGLAWTADEQAIVFTTSTYELARVPAAGGMSQTLLKPNQCASTSLWYAAFDPTGTALAFMAGAPTGEAIWVANPDGSNPRMVDPDGSQPGWSPDGSLLAFVRNLREVWVTDRGGGSKQLLFAVGSNNRIGPIAWTR
jgi:hypothetical protein